ncbi:MAG: beta-lactamase family protein [bacterium]|nr:MAG: beta-lactamase family protein [bacterium]
MNTFRFTRIHLFVLPIILFQFTTHCYSQTAAVQQNAQRVILAIDELQTEIDSLLTRYTIPGASIAIVTEDSVVYAGGLGYADVESKTKVNEHTHFRAGSITKSFVALGILKLVEDGRIDLQDPVKQIVPDLSIDNPWEATDPVRIVHLLEHTAGFNDPHFNDYYLDGDPDIPLMDGLKVSEHYLNVKWKPGAYRSYSSAGYMVAGIIIEKVTGERFEDYLKSEILDPLGMTTSTFRFTSETEQLLAQGYKASYQPSQYWHTYSRPAGSLNSSAYEMARYLQFMLNKGRIGERQIIAESTIDRMERSTTDPAAKAGLESRVGLGVGIGYYKGFKWYTHYGSIMGFCGAYGYCRDLGIGCALFTNQWDIDFEAGITRIWGTLRSYLVKDMGYEPQTPPEPEISRETLQSYAGYYKWCNPPQRLSAWIDLILNYRIMKSENNRLYYKNVFFGSWESLIPVTEKSFRGEEEFRASMVFIKTTDNEPAYIYGGSFYKKTSWFKAWLHGVLFFLSWVIMLSSIFVAIVWVPIELYKRITKKNKRTQYLRIRVIPLLAVIIILLSFILVGMQVNRSLAYIGQKTPVNIFFYLSTLGFAVLSFVSLFFAVRSFQEPVKTMERIYALILSLSCVGTTIYWGYWGIIGLKLWSY